MKWMKTRRGRIEGKVSSTFQTQSINNQSLEDTETILIIIKSI